MASFPAEIDLRVKSSGAERKVRQLERAVEKVENASRQILSVDKQIVSERRKLLGLTGDQARLQKKRIIDLRLQRTELALQKRDLQSIVRLERDRGRSSGTSALAAPISAAGRQLLVAGAAFLTIDAATRQFARSIDRATQFASANQRLKALSDGFDNLAEVEALAARTAERFNQSTIESQSSVAQLYGRLRPLGLGLEQIESVLNGFNTAAALTGSTTAESAGALLQLSQALGAGALRGEEFNSVAEQAPGVLQAIAKEVGKPVGELKELAKQGRLTTDVLIRSLERAAREGADQLAEALDTPAQKIKTLQNSVEDLQIAFGDLALPSYLQVVEDLTGAVEDATTEVRLWKDGTEGLGRAIDKTKLEIKEFLNENLRTAIDLLPVAKKLTDLLTTSVNTLTSSFVNAVPGLSTFNVLLQTYLKARGLLEDFANTPQVPQGYTGMEDMSGDPIFPTVRPPVVDPPTRSSGSSTLDVDRSVLRGIEQGQLADDRIRAAKAQDQLLERLRAQVDLEGQVTDLGRLEKQLALDLLEIRQDIANKTEEAYNNPRLLQGLREEAALRTQLAQQNFNRPFFEAGFSMGEDLAKQNQELTNLEQTLNGIGSTITNGLVQGLNLAVTETERLGEAMRDLAADILEAIGQQLILNAITSGINALAGDDGTGLFSILNGTFGGKREFGGPVRPNEAYVVGEAGPELMVPNTGGTVIPNTALQAMARYSPANASASAAISGEESMGGAGVAGGGPTNISMNYNGPTMVFDDTRYVPVTAVPGIVKEASQQGEARALRKLQMSPGARRKLGM
ncbi:tape measure protein [Synechococcus sp. A15-60]|uniref:tape measure protein n=1 Tax=Synechococcus sp. A15-60 TaxID=1050655 RepID=UPI00164749FA|nr:tape measure protein [Synechococcus sp. A15-60]QNI48854.1 tape measure domain protein [Synechococcus sp. A15-60]